MPKIEGLQMMLWMVVDMRIPCNVCGKAISTEIPNDSIIRAWVECPECIQEEKEARLKEDRIKQAFSLPICDKPEPDDTEDGG